MDQGALQQDTTTCCRDSNLAGELMPWCDQYEPCTCVCMCVFLWSARQYNHSFCDSRLLDAAYRCVSTCAPWQCRFFAAIFLGPSCLIHAETLQFGAGVGTAELGMVDWVAHGGTQPTAEIVEVESAPPRTDEWSADGSLSSLHPGALGLF